jgi:hypothetical protein
MAPWQQQAAREDNSCRKMAPWQQQAAREDKQ